MTLIERLDAICEEIFDHWDKDQRSGKLLTALAGRLPGYRNDVDVIRQALATVDRAAEVMDRRAARTSASIRCDVMTDPLQVNNLEVELDRKQEEIGRMRAALHAAVNWYTPPNDSRTPFPLEQIVAALGDKP